MSETSPHWTTRYGPLLLNVIGWVVFYFLVSGSLLKRNEPAPIAAPAAAPQVAANDAGASAMEAQLAKLESYTQKLGEQLDALEKRRTKTDDVGQRLSQAQMKKLESATSRLEDELGSLRQRTHVTVDLNQLVQGLRPNVSFGVLRVDPKKPGEIDLTFQMRNLGPYTTMIDVPELVLATKPVPQSGPADGELIAGKDYTFRAARVGALLPNEPRNHAYTIVLNDPRKLEQPLYYRMSFKTSTDPAVVGTSSRLLAGKVPDKDIQTLSVAQYSHLGEVAVNPR